MKKVQQALFWVSHICAVACSILVVFFSKMATVTKLLLQTQEMSKNSNIIILL